jgi:hypothetical protein
MDANPLLWIGQVLLALAFLTVGYGHSLGFDQWSIRPGMTWIGDVLSRRTASAFASGPRRSVLDQPRQRNHRMATR